MSHDASPASDKPPVAGDPISAEAVAAYLQTHPDFFVEHQQLLADLTLPHNSGQAISLIQRQLALLRDRNHVLGARLGTLLDTARYNDQLLSVTRSLILTLLEEERLTQIVSVTEASLSTQPGIDACALILLPAAGASSQRSARQTAAEQLPQRFPALFQKQRILCQEIDAKTAALLFPDHSERIHSLALSPVKAADGELLAILALGNHTTDHFSDALDTLFLGFIADALGAIIRRCAR